MTLYSRAHCADCELCLAGHDVSRLDVAVVHGVLERSAPISVLVAHVTIEGDFGSSSGRTLNHYSQAGTLEYTMFSIVRVEMRRITEYGNEKFNP